jgi:phasin family protein
MNNSFVDIQKLGQTNMDSAMKMWGEWGRSWQAIAAEMGEYQKRSLEDGAQTLQKLMGAKSVEQAFEIQSTYAKRAAEQYLQEMNKISGMYASLAKDAMKPVERMMQPQAVR